MQQTNMAPQRKASPKAGRFLQSVDFGEGSVAAAVAAIGGRDELLGLNRVDAPPRAANLPASAGREGAVRELIEHLRRAVEQVLRVAFLCHRGAGAEGQGHRGGEDE